MLSTSLVTKMSSMSRVVFQRVLKQSSRGLRSQSGSWRHRLEASSQVLEPVNQEKESNVTAQENPSIPVSLSSNFDPEFVKTIFPDPPVSFNFASYVDDSYTLKQLVKLGVNLSKLEEDRSLAEQLLHVKFDETIKPVIQFLVDHGVKPKELGWFLTENPFIIWEPICNLQARIDYLRSKRFTSKAITRIISSYPLYLKKSFKEVDSRLGFLQNEYHLNGNQVRSVLINFPAVVGLHVMTLRTMTFSLKEEMGLLPDQVTALVVAVPRILGESRQKVVNIFDLMHTKAELPVELILKFPEVFLAEDESSFENRLQYLMTIKRNQFDPEKPLFIPLTSLSEGDDELFAVKFARTSLEDYDLFLKTR